MRTRVNGATHDVAERGGRRGTMTKKKLASETGTAGAVDFTGVQANLVDYPPGAAIFLQGNEATSVMYVEEGTVRLSVLSQGGKEAVIAMLERTHFFGEGCLVGQPYRMATATAAARSSSSRRPRWCASSTLDRFSRSTSSGTC
jgi:hypothetical protein